MYLLVTNQGFEGLFNELRVEIIDKPVDSAKLLLPSLLYVAQNNLLFIAVTNLDPGTYQVTSQLKTLITALFAVLILRVSGFFSTIFGNYDNLFLREKLRSSSGLRFCCSSSVAPVC